MPAETGNVLAQATAVIDRAQQRGITLRLIGGLGVRVLTPGYPARVRDDQDIDFVSTQQHARALIALFGELGYEGDRRFNALHGERQMYFRTPDGHRAVDVIMNQLAMCHQLDFRRRIARLPYTLDVPDMALTKLQVVKLNEKDAQDLIYLLSAYQVLPGDDAGTIGMARFTEVIANDWGWWRTVTANLERVAELAAGALRHLVPEDATYDAAEQATQLRECAENCPKSLRWKARAKVGERARWYELPEEVGH